MTQADFELVLGEVCRAFATWPRKEVKDAYWHVLRAYSAAAVRQAVKEIQDDPDIKRLPSPIDIARRAKNYEEPSMLNQSHEHRDWEGRRKIIERHITKIASLPVLTAALEAKLHRLREQLYKDYAYTGAGHAGDVVI